MSDILISAAFVSFLVFFIAGRFRKFAAVAGWIGIVLNLCSELPGFFSEGNFLYPVLSLLSLPFLVITIGCLLSEDQVVLQLSRIAAIATVIWVPFALVPALGNTLISLVVMFSFAIITALGHSPRMLAWDVIFENGFANQIILGCTGIMAIAIMAGVVLSEKGLSIRQAVIALLISIISIFVLNLFRVAVVFIAVSDKWFSAFPDPTGTGDANFFWAHNVCAEGLALLFLIVLAEVLVWIIPSLGVFVRALGGVYLGRLRKLAGS
jgi:archaeosortase A (PGF-CTERM-specific)